MATYYKKKDEVKLKPGQTLGYTAGKGYYAAGTPTPPKPPPAAVKPSSKAAPTTTRPKAAHTPTAPPSHASPPYISPRASEDDHLTTDDARRSDARAGRSAPSSTPKPSATTAHYEHPGDVPLKPGQSLALEAERGYYAAGRPNPEKASSTPAPSTVKVTALSTRASMESPLKEHVKTDGKKTTITLSHATKPAGGKTRDERKVAAYTRERTAKPAREPARKTETHAKKASSRVHEQLAKANRRSHHPKPGIGHPPDKKKSLRRKTGGRTASANFDPAFGSKLTLPLSWSTPARPFLITTGSLIVEWSTSLEASDSGVEIQYKDAALIISWHGHTLATVSLYEALFGFRKPLVHAASRLTERDEVELEKGDATVKVPMGEGTASFSSDGDMSLSQTRRGITTTISLSPSGEVTISMSIEASVPKQIPRVGAIPVDVAVTSTLKAIPTAKASQPTSDETNPDQATVEPLPKTESWLEYFERLLIPSSGRGPGVGEGSGSSVPGARFGFDGTPVPG